MKKTILILIITLISLCMVSAKDKVIVNPVYEFSTSGITHITKIELGKKETRLHVHSTFIPGWWVKFPHTTYIEDCTTGKRWEATNILKGEFDKEISMPASGDSSFVLIFPPLDKSVNRINICCDDEKDNPIIFGISLDPKTKPLNKEIPAEVLQWIDGEMANSRRKTLMDFNAGEFFNTDTARLIGYIHGYDPRAGFATGMVYADNVITREDFPAVIQIHEDGRFEGYIPMNHPKYMNIYFSNRISINFYIQPGQTLSMLLDWEQFRIADRLRNEQYTLKNIKFQGATAAINSELSAFHAKLFNIPFRKIYEGMEGKKPDEFKVFYDECMSEYVQTHQRLLETETLSTQSKVILQNDFQMNYASYLFEYEMRNRQSEDTIPLYFYDFLQDIPMDNQELLSTQNFSVFINRLEYCTPLYVSTKFYQSMVHPEIDFFQYLFDELSIKKTPEDEDFMLMQNSLESILNSPDMPETEKNEFLSKYSSSSKDLLTRYAQQNADYTKKYNLLTTGERELAIWRLKDSAYRNELNLKQGIIYDVTKIRSLDFMFVNMLKDNKEEAWDFLASLTSDISESFLRKEADRLFLKNFPTEQRTAYELPDTYEAKVFKELIEPFKGKIILVDFWATSCGPCIYNIRQHKALREKYINSSDMAFVFITSDYESPLSAYDNFVKEQELTNTNRISADQYHYLRQLFRFNGIPRYVLVDRDGKIIDDNFSSFQIELRLKELVAEK